MLEYYDDTVRCCTTHEYVFVYTYHVLVLLLLLSYCSNALAAFAAVFCYSSSCAEWRNYSLWFIAYDLCVFFLILTLYVSNVPLSSTVAYTALISYLRYISHILDNYEHARSQGAPPLSTCKADFSIAQTTRQSSSDKNIHGANSKKVQQAKKN